MILWMATLAGLGFALLPAAMYLRNIRLFQVVGHDGVTDLSTPSVSVLIPARDEAEGIEAAIDAALASRHIDVEVVILDDHSSDATPEILRRKCDADSRVTYSLSDPLPDGWNGKQFACYQLSTLAKHDTIVFIDADVRLTADGLARLVAYRDQHGTDLLSAFPQQVTKTWLEKAIIPIMHYILLGFLPIARMRASTSAAYASGCGQLFLTDKNAYQDAGTHEAISGSRHDGLKLPRAYRLTDQSTDVVDGTEIASCRMYVSASEVIRGVLKNAIEGIANPRLIVPFTVMLLGSALLPILTCGFAVMDRRPLPSLISISAIGLSHLPRLMAAKQMRQSVWGAILHVPATILFVSLQWVALANHLLGRQVAWRGRR